MASGNQGNQYQQGGGGPHGGGPGGYGRPPPPPGGFAQPPPGAGYGQQMPPHQQGGGGSPGFDPRTGPRPQQEGRPGNASSSRTFQWISAADGFIPANAVQGGVEKDGTPLFVARAMHKGGLHPGKAGKHIQNGGCAIGYDHKELTLREYQVLCGDASQLRWINQDGGLLIQGFKPVDAGHEASGEPLYIAKTLVDGSQQLGKCAPHIKGIAYPYGHKEKNGSQYMVLAYIN